MDSLVRSVLGEDYINKDEEKYTKISLKDVAIDIEFEDIMDSLDRASLTLRRGMLFGPAWFRLDYHERSVNKMKDNTLVIDIPLPPLNVEYGERCARIVLLK